MDQCKLNISCLFRYVEENIRRSSCYRKYNSTLPTWLHDKPQKFTKHCIERLTSSHSIKKEYIHIDESNENTYLVKSMILNENYTVYLGDESNLPSCSCADWRKTLLPCKHMLAILTKGIDNLTYYNLSEKYRTSPFLTLDEEIIFKGEVDPSDENFDLTEYEEIAFNDQHVALKEMQKKIYPKRSKASAVRELLNQIKSLTFIVYDDEALETLRECLTNQLKSFSAHAPKEDNIVIERPRVIRNEIKKKYPPLPKPKNKKSVLTGRVGISTEKRKASASIKINSTKEKNNEKNIIEEFPPLGNERYDIHMVESDEKNSEEEVVITAEVKAPVDQPPKKRRKLVFSIEEKSTIANKQMLTDESVNIAQNLLKMQFPHIGGLQDTVIGKTQAFDIIKSDEKYIQILHSGSYHWICTANMSQSKKENSYCQIYDSLTGGTVHPDVAKQIAAFSFCPSSEIVAEVMPVQQQNNGVDCGLFAIAFATSLAFNEDPALTTYDTKLLRTHLISCLEVGKMSLFPKKNVKVKTFQGKINTIELYCACRMPYVPHSEEDDMIECSKCYEWYHKSCANIVSLKEYKRKNWYCQKCDR